MMTASQSIPPITPTHTTDTTNVVVSSSSVSRSLYHSIRTASPPPTPPPLHHQHHHMHKKRCIDPPGRNSEKSQDNDDDDDEHHNYIDTTSNNNGDEDDRSFDWSSISSVDDHDHQDFDVSMADPVNSNTNANATTLPTPPAPRRKVTFGMMEIYEVPSLSEYRMEDNSSFWYTSMDMISTRRAGRLATMSDASVKNYLYHYEFLYKKLQNDSDHRSNNNAVSSESLHLTEFDTKILAYGLRAGYQGLEREGPFEKIRQDERRAIVKRVVQAHWSLTHTDNNNNNDNCHNLLYREEAVRTVATALTHHMSVWAASLGQAAHFAMD